MVSNNIKNKVTSVAKNILDRVMLKDYPKLNTQKIAKFYTDFVFFMWNITSTIILIGTFTWYLPTMYGLQNDKIIIVLLCIIIFTLRTQKSE